MNESVIDYENNNIMRIKFEKLKRDPLYIIDRIEKCLGINSTDITKKHIESIKTYKQKNYNNQFKYIQEPEKGKYVKMMEKLGYEAESIYNISDK